MTLTSHRLSSTGRKISQGHARQCENSFNLATITKSTKRLKATRNWQFARDHLTDLKTAITHASIRLLQNNRVNTFSDLLNLSLIILITNVEAEDS